MSFGTQRVDFQALAKAALTELHAPEPAETTEWLVQEGRPLYGANVATMRTSVVAACRDLQAHPALRLHCTCGQKLDFLALLAVPSHGVHVVSSPRRLPPKLRSGGFGDLDPTAIGNDDPEPHWVPATQTSPVLRPGDPFPATLGTSIWIAPEPASGALLRCSSVRISQRRTFVCDATRCNAAHTLLNVSLLHLVLEAIAAGQDEVRLISPAAAASAPQR